MSLNLQPKAVWIVERMCAMELEDLDQITALPLKNRTFWTIYLTSLGLGFLIYKMGIVSTL